MAPSVPVPELARDEKTHGEDQLHEYADRPAARFADGQSLAEYTTTTSEKAGSSRYAESDAGLEHVRASKAAERKLVRKLDVLIMPLAMLLYLSAYLDRGALGNAKLQGLEEDLLEPNPDVKYSIALSCFFITYILFSIPGTLLAKQFNPSLTISCGALVWSLATSAQALCTNAPGLYVCRLFIGLGEAFFGQAIAFYLTLWYLKTELAKRIGFFISAGSVAGAFSGLIAYGVAQIDSKIAAWRILFAVEGLPSLALAVVVFFCLPSRPDKTRYLNESQRTVACTRLNAHSQGNERMGIQWAAVRYALSDWRLLVLCISYSAMNLTLGSVSGFLPTIVKGLGYTSTQAQLYSVPPYATALGCMLLLTTLSDRLQSRGLFVVLVYCIGLVGWCILLAVNPIGVTAGGLRARYFACCCLASAGYSNIPLIMAWVASNAPNESQRAASMGSLNSVGQCLSILAAFLFPKIERPRLIKGASVNIAFQSLGVILALSMTLYYRRENRKRDLAEGGPPPKGMRIENIDTEYDRAKGFRYTV
ncbi:hypothetical protein BMF94_6252 [Rhodotorula taiwanensis]|uniref:Major facilitator superfamily (MFS) profile domain-containing protein n=1 Tax=Rhodotorula taiwanensis TaxID=741276 RepID=A0A2S5B233_9BASI|nr:hypothetical protein BMF94_6252 [Rhodotorula taiwanensis]